MTDSGWTLPLYLARSAWADLPYDAVLDGMLAADRAHLLEVTGEVPDEVLDLDLARGPAVVLPLLLSTLRAAASWPATDSLALLTASPGDVSGVPAVSGLATSVLASGAATLVRDPRTRRAFVVDAVAAGPDVVRWTLRCIADCPAAPQPDGVGQAANRLSEAVERATDLITAATAAGVAPARSPDLAAAAVSPLPPGLPSRAMRLLDRADRVEAIVGLALRHRGDGNAPEAREPVLRGLRSAIDTARRSAVAATGQEALAALSLADRG